MNSNSPRNARGLVRYAAALAAGIAVSWALPAAGQQDGWSLFPPLVAILTAVATGRLALGLGTAIVAAAAISMPDAGGWTLPFAVLQRAAVDFVWAPLRESFQLYILAFTASLVGMVRVVVLAGGTQGIADLLARRAQGARSARLASFLMGMAIFFDDYANTLVVGTTMRPICDGFRVSREKLAYIVDSTAAPVAGLALISTWIGYEVGLFEGVMKELNTGISGYELFFLALPSRFYCLLSLVLVACTVLMRRDYGPMLTAERRAAATGAVLRQGARPMTGERSDSLKPPQGVRPHWWIAALPVGLVVFGVLGGMQWDAWNAPEVEATRRGFFLADGGYWIAVFSNASGARVMFLASMAGTAAAAALALTRRSPDGAWPLGAHRVAAAWIGGIASFRHALVVLLLAWAIKEACQAVGTDDYLDLGPGNLPGSRSRSGCDLPAGGARSLCDRDLLDDDGDSAALGASARLGTWGNAGRRAHRRGRARRRHLRGPLLSHQRHHPALEHSRGMRPHGPRAHADSLRPDGDGRRRGPGIRRERVPVFFVGRSAAGWSGALRRGAPGRQGPGGYQLAVVRSTISSITISSPAWTARSRPCSSSSETSAS